MNEALLERISNLRDEKGISQRQLLRDLNLSASTISKWKTSTPRHETLQAVADYFNVSTDYLIGRTKYRNREHMLQSFDLNYKLDLSDTKIHHDQCIQTDEGIIFVERTSPAPKYIDPSTRQIAETIMEDVRLKELFELMVDLPPKKMDTLYNMLTSFLKA